MDKETMELNPSKAKELIEKDKKERSERCRQMIEKALQETKCELSASMAITARGNFPRIDIIAIG